MSDSRTYGLTFKEVLLIDSTTIRLFSDVLKGVGRNPKGDGKKGEAKVLSDEIIELEYHPENESGKKQTKITKSYD